MRLKICIFFKNADLYILMGQVTWFRSKVDGYNIKSEWMVKMDGLGGGISIRHLRPL